MRARNLAGAPIKGSKEAREPQNDRAGQMFNTEQTLI